MMSDKISIVIPAYNIEKVIERCVNSVLAQTYSNIEVVIVNDGSTDGTLKVLRSLKKRDSRISVIDKLNEGVTKARLTGVEASTGEWVGFVDGDDYIEPEMYEHLFYNAQKYRVNISHCGYQMVFPSRIHYFYNTRRIVKQDNITGMKDLLEGSFIEPGLCNKLFHKTLFHSLLHDNIMDFSIKNTEDLLMNYYLFSECNASVYEDFCPYHYIVREDSAANKRLNQNQLLDPIKVTKVLLREVKGSIELMKILEQKYVRQLITLSSMKLKENPNLIGSNRHNARVELRKMLPSILCNNSYSLKIKGMAFLTVMCPVLNRFIHSLYGKITGLDKIYEIR